MLLIIIMAISLNSLDLLTKNSTIYGTSS